MPAPKQPPSDPADASLPPEGEISSAARLLDEIRERMERLEGNLSLRERRLARVEKALREADTRLQAERARFTSERDSLEQGLSQRLRERERQLEESRRSLQEHQQRLGAQLARERETLARIERLARERDEAAGELEKTRRELSEQQRRERELEARVAEIERRRVQWEHAAEPAESKRTPAEAPWLADSPPPWVMRWSRRVRPYAARWRRLTHQQQVAVIAAAIALPLMCLLVGITTFVRYPTTYAVTSWVLGDAEDAEALTSFAARGPFQGVQARVDARRGAMELTQVTRAPEEGAKAVETAAAEALRSLAAPATRPAEFIAREQRRQELKAQLEAAVSTASQPSDPPTAGTAQFAQTRPAGLPADPARLLDDLKSALTQREQVSGRLTQIAQRLAAKPPQTLAVPPEALQAAMTADQRLQADIEVLEGRETELTGALRQVLDAARVRFDDLPRRAEDAEKAATAMGGSDADASVTDALSKIRGVLSDLSAASASLSAVWQEQRGILERGGPEADPGARQAAMETAARAFLDTSGRSMDVIKQVLDGIAQSGDEPVKRLVLRKNLAEKLQPVMESRDALAASASAVLAAENVELAGLLGRVTGLRAKVQDRRGRLEQSLRQQILAEAQSAYQREAASLVRERDQLSETAVQLDGSLIRHAVAAFWLLHDRNEASAAVLAHLNAERARAAALAELRALDEADARETAAAGRPVILRAGPATATAIPQTAGRLGRAVLGALAPILLAVVVGATLWSVQRWREPRESIEAYARALREPLPSETREIPQEQHG